jgi:hypothetical protein
MNKVYIVEHFLSQQEIDLINMFLKTGQAKVDVSGYSPYKTYATNGDENLINCFNIIYIRMKNLIEKSFNCILHEEGLSSVTELNVGDSMPLHLDHGSALNKSVGLKTGSGHPTRDISSVLYHNDNYIGGEICFPNQNIILKPKPGTFIYFPAQEDFPHEVKTITEGIRWCSTNFWCIKKD